MPSADQVPVNNPHSTMRWHKWVFLIAGSTGSALRAVRPPNLHITPDFPAGSRLTCKRDGFLVAFAPGHHGPGHPRNLVGQRDRSNLCRAPRQQCREPRPVFRAVDLGIANDGECAGREQAAQIAVTLFADAAEPVLAPARALLRHEPDPGREVSSRSEDLWISNTRNQGRGQRRTDTGNLIEPHAHFVGSVPSHDPTIKLQDLRFQHPQLCDKRRETAACKFRYPLVTGIGDHIKQLLDTLSSYRRDNPDLSKMSTDRVDHGGLLTDKQMARAMKHQTTLLLGRLGRDEPHIGPGDRFTDSLGICRIVLLPFDVGLHVGRWHQAYGVTKRLKLARPMM